MYDLIMVFRKLYILLYIIYIDNCSNSVYYKYSILIYYTHSVDFILGDFLEVLEGVFFTRVSFFFVGVGVGVGVGNDPLVIFRDVLIL